MMAPYAVTKGAAIALAEILRVELKGTSIKPSLLIPGPVRTPFRETSQRHSTVQYDPQAEIDLQRQLDSIGINPDDVATFVLERIYKGAFYIFTHCGHRAAINDQFKELLTASDIGIAALRATSADK
jgi:short-subunit dehydrogenase